MNNLFKALNDPTRRKILDLLKAKDMSAGEIAEHFDISKPSISHHLELLNKADLVEKERDGQFIYYSLNTTSLEEAAQWMVELLKNND
ncbi:autorepressor SdpR family transcription factor [Balneola sp. MJW-20]|uniref:autorepressor SdpR family transcription factor n=1 Tax=Gracilimonas aurantiaca TaxID=3234185 RepID=UPI0034674A6E